jgi:hypothetical protein
MSNLNQVQRNVEKVNSYTPKFVAKETDAGIEIHGNICGSPLYIVQKGETFVLENEGGDELYRNPNVDEVLAEACSVHYGCLTHSLVDGLFTME